jgi:hypothetical protein
VCRPGRQLRQPVAEPELGQRQLDVVVARVGAAVAHVLEQRRVEQEAVLRHHDDARRSDANDTSSSGTPASSTRPRLGSISRVSSFANVVFRCRLADDGHPAARRELEGDVVQHLRPAGVGERDALEAHADRALGQRETGLRVGDVGRGVEHRQHPAQSGDGVLRLVQDLCGDLNRLDEQRDQEQEAHQLTDGDVAVHPESTPTTTTAPVATDAVISPEENVVAAMVCAFTWERCVSATALSMRAAVRSCTP